ncbi:MAG: peptide-binding protein [Nitrospinae bacterium]|nr:peptide-binding protein [Nitrospinota bacterium]
MKRALITAVLLLATAGAPPYTVHAAETHSAPAHGDMLVEASIGDASNLIPMLAGDASSHAIAGLVYSGLVRYDQNWEIEGELAESWEIKNKGKTIIFHLRTGVKWHDGAPFTSADVMFGYRTIINKNTPTPYSEDFLQVEKAEAPDDLTFIVHYKKPFAPALASWGMLTVLPRHLLEGKDITKSELSRKPIGTGPYRFVEWRAQERIVLEANKEYFEGEPWIRRYVFRIVPDTATQFLELKTGALDLMNLTPIQYSRQTGTKDFQQNFQRFSYTANAYTYMGYNLRRDIFKDVRVRKAIAYAIDRNEIVQGALMGLGKPTTGPYKPGTWQYNQNAVKYDYSPEKARQLLAEAGWKDTNGDGVLDKGGKKFEFEIITNLGNDTRKKTAEIIQGKLKNVGISVKIRVLEWASFLKEFINKRNFDATILGWTVSPDPDIYDIWHSSKTKESEFNFITYKNAEVDRLLETGRRSFDKTVRKKAYDRIQEILAEEQPYCFLFSPYALPAVSARVHGVELNEATTGIGYNWPMKWWVPATLQKYKFQP